ncbi:hypothetical protein [Kribbella hippodromi]
MITELLEESTEARRIVDIESDQLNALPAHREAGPAFLKDLFNL